MTNKKYPYVPYKYYPAVAYAHKLFDAGYSFDSACAEAADCFETDAEKVKTYLHVRIFEDKKDSKDHYYYTCCRLKIPIDETAVYNCQSVVVEATSLFEAQKRMHFLPESHPLPNAIIKEKVLNCYTESEHANEHLIEDCETYCREFQKKSRCLYKSMEFK